MAAKSNLLNMTLVLTLTCLVCSALLAFAHALTEEPIRKAAADKLDRAIAVVVPAFDSTEAMKVECGGTESNCYKAVKDGETVGYAFESTTSGFGGMLTVLVGITPDGKVYNTDVLVNNETPGLGAKCTEKNSLFRTQWEGLDPAVKILAVKQDNGDIDAITASTITSRAYTLAVSNALSAFAAMAPETGEQAQNNEEGIENE